jgi:hypothetical protein
LKRPSRHYKAISNQPDIDPNLNNANNTNINNKDIMASFFAVFASSPKHAL